MRRWGLVTLALLGALAFAATLHGADTAAPVTLKTTEFGRGPTIVLLHSVGSGRMVWMPTAKRLLASHRVVMVDLPGHGESPLPAPFSIEACAEALDQVLAKHKPDSTVLVAHGMAGLVALYEVNLHPDRIKGLVVIDAATRSPIPISEQQQQYFLNALDTNYDEMMKMMLMRQGRDSTQGNELYAQVQSVQPATVKAYFKAAMNADGSAGVKKTKALLFVASSRLLPADGDWPTLAKQMGYEAEVPVRRVPDSAALIMKDQPDTLSAVLAEFTARAIAAKK